MKYDLKTEEMFRIIPEDLEVHAMNRYCVKCGNPLEEGAKFCNHCGNEVYIPHPQQRANNVNEGFFDRFIDRINGMTGEQGEADIKLKELFSQTFKKHKDVEKELLYVSGMSFTTPEEKDMLSQWPSPWLYGRVFLSLGVVFAGLWVMVEIFGNAIAVPGLIFIGALLVPFSLSIFFWEVNVPRNISIFDCVRFFFVGGVLSLVSTSIVYAVIGDLANISVIGAFFVGFAEELGKAVISIYYAKKFNSKYVLNGLLIGACVGAGFAVFETAGYLFLYALQVGIVDMLELLYVRSFFSVGTHLMWTAIVTAAFVSVKQDKAFNISMIGNKKFIRFFLIAVLLHALWDMPFAGRLLYSALSTIAIIIVLVMISAGLRQISRVVNQANRTGYYS